MPGSVCVDIRKQKKTFKSLPCCWISISRAVCLACRIGKKLFFVERHINATCFVTFMKRETSQNFFRAHLGLQSNGVTKSTRTRMRNAWEKRYTAWKILLISDFANLIFQLLREIRTQSARTGSSPLYAHVVRNLIALPATLKNINYSFSISSNFCFFGLLSVYFPVMFSIL